MIFVFLAEMYIQISPKIDIRIVSKKKKHLLHKLILLDCKLFFFVRCKSYTRINALSSTQFQLN